jgi:hypothetical protein
MFDSPPAKRRLHARTEMSTAHFFFVPGAVVTVAQLETNESRYQNKRRRRLHPEHCPDRENIRFRSRKNVFKGYVAGNVLVTVNVAVRVVARGTEMVRTCVLCALLAEGLNASQIRQVNGTTQPCF